MNLEIVRPRFLAVSEYGDFSLCKAEYKSGWIEYERLSEAELAAVADRRHDVAIE